MVHVYTGTGKGKTTAALGLALRAAGHGMRVYMIQFMKGDINYGELASAESVPNLTIVQFGRPSFVDRDEPEKEDIGLAQKGLNHASEIIARNDIDILVLDELNVAVDFGLVDIEDVLSLIESRPGHMELVITGRNAHERVMEKADYVTDMRKVKHPYDSGVLGRLGIEH